MARRRAKKSDSSREASLRKRAANRGYTLAKEGDRYYAVTADGSTRYGPLNNLDEVEEWLPAEL
jgi:hypothetical protein